MQLGPEMPWLLGIDEPRVAVDQGEGLVDLRQHGLQPVVREATATAPRLLTYVNVRCSHALAEGSRYFR